MVKVISKTEVTLSVKEAIDIILKSQSIPTGNATLKLEGDNVVVSCCSGAGSIDPLLLDKGVYKTENGWACDHDLNLHGCTSLTKLPDGLSVGGYLNLGGCTSLTQLPDGLSVDGFLFLGGCTSLTHLPDSLSVGGDLFLGGCTGCTSITQIPDGLSVGGDLYLGWSGINKKGFKKPKGVKGIVYFRWLNNC